MATTYGNWICDKNIVSEKDVKALENAKALELKKIKEGYKYVPICKKMKILVPFGKDGKPTKEAQERIEAKKKLYGIK